MSKSTAAKISLSSSRSAFAPARRASESCLEAMWRVFDRDPMLRAVLDAVPDMVMVLNAERQVVFANRACLRLFGSLTDRDVLGQRPGELLGCIHATERVEGCGTTEFCRTCGAVGTILTSLSGKQAVSECQITLRTGDALDLRVWGRPLVVDGARFSVFSVQDIGHEKRRRALERIYFHDIMNSATAIVASLELLEKNSEDRVQILDDLRLASQRLVDEIVAQKMLLAAENGALQPQRARVLARTLLEEMRQMYEPLAYERPIVLAADLPDVSLRTDPSLLRRVLGNMIKNALEASRDGEPVTVRCDTDGEHVTFSVHNVSLMPPDVQQRVFHRSFSTKGEGRGLGTYSMKFLTERYLHGRVWFETAPQTGTTFHLRCPRECDQPG